MVCEVPPPFTMSPTLLGVTDTAEVVTGMPAAVSTIWLSEMLSVTAKVLPRPGFATLRLASTVSMPFTTRTILISEAAPGRRAHASMIAAHAAVLPAVAHGGRPVRGRRSFSDIGRTNRCQAFVVHDAGDPGK